MEGSTSTGNSASSKGQSMGHQLCRSRRLSHMLPLSKQPLQGKQTVYINIHGKIFGLITGGSSKELSQLLESRLHLLLCAHIPFYALMIYIIWKTVFVTVHQAQVWKLLSVTVFKSLSEPLWPKANSPTLEDKPSFSDPAGDFAAAAFWTPTDATSASNSVISQGIKGIPPLYLYYSNPCRASNF